MNLIIRPFQEDADYDHLEETEKLIIPDEWDSAEYYRIEDQQNAAHPQGRWLAFDGDQPIGNAEYLFGHWWDEPAQYIFYIGVIPDYQGKGIGKRLMDTVMTELDTLGARSTITWVRDDYRRTMRFLEERGYSMIQRDAQSALDIATFDPAPFAGITSKLKQNGITLHTVTQLEQNDPNWQKKLYDLDWPLRLDMPGTEKKKQESFDDWIARKFATPYLLKDGYIVAVTENGDYIGYSAVYKSSTDEPKLNTNVTGVLGAWRRKGIATAMKVAIIDYAKANDYKKIVTENEENNPMYELNIRLGFRPTPAWLTYKKKH